MKIGMFGGTFNPIHKAHIYLAEEFQKAIGLDFVMLMPTYIPPHKSPENLASPKDRFAMCKLAAKTNPKILVSDYEINKKGKSYTYQTLEWLRETYPKDELFLIMGSDMYMTIDEWRNPEIIYSLATLCVSAREENEYQSLNKKLKALSGKGAKSIVLKIAPKPMSSTLVRRLIKENQPVEQFLLPEVIDYITGHSLYKEGGNDHRGV